MLTIAHRERSASGGSDILHATEQHEVDNGDGSRLLALHAGSCMPLPPEVYRQILESRSGYICTLIRTWFDPVFVVYSSERLATEHTDDNPIH